MFTHLHCHSHFSLLDGLSKVSDLVTTAKQHGMDSLALTDHGVMYGAIEFYNTCLKEGLKPIIGMEAYIAPRGMKKKEGKLDADYYHLTLLAKNYQGYKNLMVLATLSHTEGFYYKPRIDLALLKQYHEGLIALSGCPRGQIPRALQTSATAGEQALAEHLAIFGEDNFFLELQRNSLTNHELMPNEQLVELSTKMGVRVAATQDCHYLNKDDAEAQDVMVCIGIGRTVNEAGRLDMREHDLSLSSPEVMIRKFTDLPDAITNTQLIAKQVDLEIPINQRYFAQVQLPPNTTPETELTSLVKRRAQEIYGPKGGITKEVQERIDYELDIIIQMGFAVYFLMVAEIVTGAHELGALTNTRGSAAGSIVAYLLNISAIDPLEYQLPFERFLTIHRPTPPAVDLDIADDRRDEVIAWIADKYGHDKVAQIITFGTMKARAVVRDVGRALGVPYGKCDRIAKMIPLGKQGFTMTLEKAIAMVPELATIYRTDAETKQIIDIAKRLEGCVRHASIHAAALAITPTPLTDYTPLQLEPDGHRLITQYDMYALDVGADSNAIGVVKMDLLGIRNLSFLGAAIKLVKIRHNIEIDPNRLPLDDKKTYQLLSQGHTFGVFQLGSSGITRYLKELRPTSIFDISAMIALYRPGPMGIIPQYIIRKHNPQQVDYFDERMKDYLERSLGLLVYQDDVLLTAINIAGYTWEEADKLRKAMGKKIPAEMAKQKVKFIDGCIKNGMTSQRAAELFTLIEPFAAYGFNKAHAASYSQVSYQTAYMKANYTVEFMASLMSAESGDENKIHEAFEECKNLGITVLPPDVTESYGGFTVIDEYTIRFGLRAIKNLGSDVIRKIIDCHKAGIKFESLEDFLTKSYTKNFNKRSWEALVKAGALDKFGERAELLASTEHVLDFLRENFKHDQTGQNSLFGKSFQIGKLQLKPANPIPPEDLLKFEKEHLGLFVSGHPLDRHRLITKDFLNIKDINEAMDNQSVTVAGIFTKVKRTITKKNDPMAFATLEDRTSSVEVLVFPNIMPAAIPYLDSDLVLRLNGKISYKDGQAKLILNDIKDLPTDELYLMALEELEKQTQLTIHLPDIQNQTTLHEIKVLLEANPGNAPVYLQVGDGSEKNTIKTKTSVRINRKLIEKLRAIPEVSMIYDRLNF
ncbi:MAG TPA: DNA polymerase III subunit alpha [Candidatus Doudnabacteria bacterium]|nr:DNA polymerase III subunit alpha [Candidatus Doudnabacteria bacterium]